MPLPLAIATYFTIWWITLFAVLPFGVTNAHEAGVANGPKGSDPGAPMVTNLRWKALWTTAISAVLFAALYTYIVLTD